MKRFLFFWHDSYFNQQCRNHLRQACPAHDARGLHPRNDVNLKGAFNFSATLKLLSWARTGRIINISSVSGLQGKLGSGKLRGSKAGLIGFTKSVAKELARARHCNAIAPWLMIGHDKDFRRSKAGYKKLIPWEVRQARGYAEVRRSFLRPELISRGLSSRLTRLSM